MRERKADVVTGGPFSCTKLFLPVMYLLHIGVQRADTTAEGPLDPYPLVHILNNEPLSHPLPTFTSIKIN